MATDEQGSEEHGVAFMAQFTADDLPVTVGQARKSPNWPQWKQAMEKEMRSHKVNHTWDLTEHTKDIRNVIGTRWVFAVKYDSTGKLVRYKARLVAQGFSQIQGIDFEDTYAPVVRYDSLRILLRVAAARKLDVHQMDFDTAYLNSSLTEEIYAKHPPGVNILTGDVNDDDDGSHQAITTSLILKLCKTLYGLKQSGREWFGTLRESLQRHGFQQLNFDPCVFAGDVEGQQIIIAVYVDDLLLIGELPAIAHTKKLISESFECKDLGPVKYLLGLEINVGKEATTITQLAYAERVLERFGMENSNPRHTPVDAGTFPHRSNSPTDPEHARTYQQLVG